MRLIKLIEKRNEVGDRLLTEDRRKNHNNLIEMKRIENLIIEEILNMYKRGDLFLLEKLDNEGNDKQP